MLEPSKQGQRLANPRAVMGALVLSAALGGCYKYPEGVKTYAATLRARADGQYALISDDAAKKSLVIQDASLQCKIDQDENAGDPSPACQCAKSTSWDWTTDCKAWLGDHTPQKVTCPAPAAAPAAPAAASVTPAPAASAPAAPES